MEDLKSAMRAGEKDRVEVLRMIKTALQMAAIDDKDFTEDKQLKILAKESKKRKDAAKMFKDGGDDARSEAELKEAEIIDAYLPEQMVEEEIKKIVEEIISASESTNIGQIMGAVMAKVSGRADGGLVSKIVKDRMNV